MYFSHVKREVMEAKLLCLNFALILFSFASTVFSDDCVYTIYVKTGSVDAAGTDANVGVVFYDAYGGNFTITPDLSRWGGLMGNHHDYYERNSLDIFSGRGSCLSGFICKMDLFHDNSGIAPGWYVDYIEVSQTGLQAQHRCNQKRFEVNQWLAKDEPPNYNTKATKGWCPNSSFSTKKLPTLLNEVA